MAHGHERGPGGVRFPLVDGRRSSLATGRAVLADAVRAADPALAAHLAGEGDWRRAYPAYLREVEALGARDGASALGIARDGLAAMRARLEFSRAGVTTSLGEALTGAVTGGRAGPRGPRFGCATVTGAGPRVRRLAVPVEGRELHGDPLRRQLDAWVAQGVVEPSFAAAVGLVAANPEWLDLSDRSFALLGAGAELGPLGPLSGWGADVLAVDVPSPGVQTRVLSMGHAGAGRVRVPVRPPGAGAPADVESRAGADLLTDAPEVRTWLAGAGRPLVVADTAYAEGADFVRLVAAADAVTAALLADGLVEAVAVLGTPTDVYAVPPEVVADARGRHEQAAGSAAAQLLRRVSGGRLYSPHYATGVRTRDGREVGIADCLVLQQGPNYALAKRLQRWRALLVRESGTTTSANVAPPSRTRSVLANRVLAAAYRGAPWFGVEVFEPATTRVLMAALLVHDLRNPAAAAAPGTPLLGPLDLFAQGAAHGGLWRNPYEPRSVLGLAVAAGLAHSAGIPPGPS